MKLIDKPGNSNKKRTRNKPRRSRLRKSVLRPSLTRLKPTVVVRVAIVDLTAPVASHLKIQT